MPPASLVFPPLSPALMLAGAHPPLWPSNVLDVLLYYSLLLSSPAQPSQAQPGPTPHMHIGGNRQRPGPGGGGGDFCLSFGQRTQTGRQAGERSRGASERASGRAGAVCGEKTENNTVALRRMARRVRAERPFGGFPVCRSDTITKTTEDRLHRSDP